MNIREAEQVSNSHFSLVLAGWAHRSRVFSWATKKKFDHRVSEDYRQRAKVVADIIWEWTGRNPSV